MVQGHAAAQLAALHGREVGRLPGDPRPDRHDLNGEFHGLGDPAEQTEQAFRNLAVLMEEAGAVKQDICKIKVWVTDRAHLEPVMRVVGKHMKGIPVTTSEVIINGLARAHMDMEIDVYAVIDRDVPR